MGQVKRNLLFLLVFIFIDSFACIWATNSTEKIRIPELESNKSCNLYEGEWVYDETYPIYNSSKCRMIRERFDCLKYGRPDKEFLKYRWQPNGCDLLRFDGLDLLRRMKGKYIMFIGDSLSLNHWQSLVCLLQVAVGGLKTKRVTNDSSTTVIFKEYNVSVTIFTSQYLVDIEEDEIGRILKLDSLKNGKIWKKMDVLIFNTGRWWNRQGTKQLWDYIEDNGKIVKDMNRMVAFRKALTTWALWVESNVDPYKTKVFFQAISPSHYKGVEWDKPGVKNCSMETTPINGSTYPGGELLPAKVLKQVLNSSYILPKIVHLLDITTLSQLRKDGHPGTYNGLKGMDCTHWCVAGVPDTWNQILYTVLVNKSDQEK